MSMVLLLLLRNSQAFFSVRVTPTVHSHSHSYNYNYISHYYYHHSSSSSSSSLMPRGVKKENLPSKICVTCHRPFTWRKKWERSWEEITTCSKSCNAKRRAGNRGGGGGGSGGALIEDDSNDDDGDNNDDYDYERDSKTETKKKSKGGKGSKDTTKKTKMSIVNNNVQQLQDPPLIPSHGQNMNLYLGDDDDDDDQDSLDHHEGEMFDMFEKLDIISTLEDLYDSGADADSDKEGVTNTMDISTNEKAERKATKKAQKAERRAQRQGLGDPTSGQKSCNMCSQSVNLLVRCTYDESLQWKMVCGKCWNKASGGVVDGDGTHHPYYRYGGLWKNRRAQQSVVATVALPK
jgi:hypothetical protein